MRIYRTTKSDWMISQIANGNHSTDELEGVNLDIQEMSRRDTHR